MTILGTAIDLLFIQDDIVQRTKIYNSDFDIYMFEQTWGSTALGFGGVGGSAMTTATTYVLVPQSDEGAYVYFGSRFAYKVDRITDAFQSDLRSHNMASVMESGKYKGHKLPAG